MDRDFCLEKYYSCTLTRNSIPYDQSIADHICLGENLFYQGFDPESKCSICLRGDNLHFMFKICLCFRQVNTKCSISERPEWSPDPEI